MISCQEIDEIFKKMKKEFGADEVKLGRKSLHRCCKKAMRKVKVWKLKSEIENELNCSLEEIDEIVQKYNVSKSDFIYRFYPNISLCLVCGRQRYVHPGFM